MSVTNLDKYRACPRTLRWRDLDGERLIAEIRGAVRSLPEETLRRIAAQLEREGYAPLLEDEAVVASSSSRLR